MRKIAGLFAISILFLSAHAHYEQCYTLLVPAQFAIASGPQCGVPRVLSGPYSLVLYRFEPSTAIAFYSDKPYTLNTPDYDATLCCAQNTCYFKFGFWFKC